MNIERQTSIDQGLIGAFLCTQLPSEIPTWITIKERVVESGYWGQFDWNDEHIQKLLEQSIDWLTVLPIYLASLGFEGVEAVEWRTVNEHSSSLELNFRNTVGRMWTSMRILQTFSSGQLQACADTSNEPAQRIVSQLYRFDYLRLRQQYHRCFAGNEDVYCLVRNTGAKAPLLFEGGVLYDLNTHQIYQAKG